VYFLSVVLSACASVPAAHLESRAGAGYFDFEDDWNYDDPAASESRFRARLSTPPAAAPEYRAELRTQLARAQGLQRHFGEARKTLQEAERGLSPQMHRARVRIELERGRILRSSGNSDAARGHFESALKLAQEMQFDYHAVDAAHMLALVAASPKEALDWNRKALRRALASHDRRTRRWDAALYNNIAWAQHDAGDYGAALDAFERSRSAYARHGRPDEERIARWAIAHVLRKQGRNGEALERQRALAAEFAAADKRGGYVFEEIAECLLALGRPTDAAPYFRLAFDELSQDPNLAATEKVRLERLKRLAAPQH
jgi:tetratricopeptide (TPR) repeat protein